MQLFLEWLSGGVANAITSAILNPMDISKTRMQTQRVSSNMQTASMFETLKYMYKGGGLVGLWFPGLSASMARELLYSGPRAGFYVPLRNYISTCIGENGEGEHSYFCKVTTAMATGTLGAIIANPVDVVKIRLMVDPTKYNSLVDALRVIQQGEGVRGLYKGVVPSTLRGAFICAGELATYDQTKSTLKSFLYFKEGPYLHTISSLITGLVATTVAAPFDVIKTRTMNGTNNETPLRILYATVSNEGPFALLRGWLPSYLRLGPHALICFPLLEQIRRLLGLSYI